MPPASGQDGLKGDVAACQNLRQHFLHLGSAQEVGPDTPRSLAGGAQVCAHAVGQRAGEESINEDVDLGFKSGTGPSMSSVRGAGQFGI